VVNEDNIKDLDRPYEFFDHDGKAKKASICREFKRTGKCSKEEKCNYFHFSCEKKLDDFILASKKRESYDSEKSKPSNIMRPY